mgnify:CR=1 FL=1
MIYFFRLKYIMIESNTYIILSFDRTNYSMYFNYTIVFITYIIFYLFVI